MNEIEIYKCHLFVTLMMYYNSSKRKFEKKGKYGDGESWRDFISYRLDAEKDKTGAPVKRLSLAFAPVFRRC